MSFYSWLRNRNSGSAPRSYRPCVERLEARELLALVNLTLTVTTVATNDNGYAKFFAAVTIDGVRQESPREFGTSLIVNWPITQQVDDGAPIQVEIELLDEGQGPLDIDPKRGDKTILLSVDALTGIYNGFIYGDLLQWPQTFSDGVGGDGRAGNLSFSISIPGVTTDQDGDGLLDGWERSGIDLDIDRSNGVDLPLPRANPRQKDLFVEVDAMAGRAPVPLPTISNVFPTTPISVLSRFHGLSTGTRVTLSGISGTGNTAALNGNTFTVTRISDFTFELDGTTGGSGGSGSTGGGAWSLTSLIEAGLTATGTSLDLVVDAFLRAPVSNPDGSTGIRLHVELDELALPLVPWTNDADGDTNSPLFGEDINGNGILDSGEDANNNTILDNADGDDQGGGLMYSRLRTSNFGTAAQRSSPAAMMLKELTHRYGPFVDTKVDSLGDKKGVTTGSSGMAYSASSFMVSLGAWGPPGGVNADQAGTFMHELGHTLGLGHGGGDGANNKPNYYSVMNYTWQVPEGGDLGSSWRLDYSTGNFPALDETALNESVGIGGMAGRFTRIGSKPVPGGTPTSRIVPQTGPVDWDNTDSDSSGTRSDDGDGNPATDVPVSADINYDGATAGIQNDFNDWANLRYGISTAQAGFSPPDDVHFTYEQFLIQSESFIYHSPAGNGADNLTLRKSGDDLELVNDADGAVLVRRPFNGVTFVIVTGADLEDDRLTIAFAGGNPIPSGGVRFDGGAGATDTLAMSGSPPAAPQYVSNPFAGPDDGRLEMGSSLVQFTGLEFVRPVAPEITSFTVSPAAINENNMVSLAGAFLDAGSMSSHSITIDWGDGQVEGPLPMAAGTRTFAAAHRYRDDNPSITPSDTYSVTFTLTDDDFLTAVRTPSVPVNNVRPTLQNVAVTPQIDEDGVVTLSGDIADPGTQDTFTLIVNWGEGLPQSFTYPAGTTTFSETHQYYDDNPSATPQDTYTIALNLSDDDGGADTAALTTLVKNVRPTLLIVGVTPQIDEDGVVTLSGGISDPGTQDTFTLIVNWGEGLPQTFTYPVGTTSFSETHRYLDENPTATSQDTYNISLTLSDDDSGADTAALTTLVNNLAPVIVAFISDAVECGDKAEGDTVHVVGAFTDVGTQDTHSASISWGDGATTSATIVEAGGTGSIAGEHVYANGGMFRIVITLTDDDTGQATTQTFALITGVGILNGQLQIVGTKQADDVTVNLTGNGWFNVHASFIADSPRSLPSAGVTSIAMILCDGDDRATVTGNIGLATYMNGEEGDDQLNGGGGPNILLGGEGNDRINGGSNHDILVGGTGADCIVGSGGDDILIAGTLGGSADPIDQLDELLAILAEWQLYRERTRTRARLSVGGDNAADTLTGSAGFDWFFYDLVEDRLTDGKNEASENIG